MSSRNNFPEKLYTVRTGHTSRVVADRVSLAGTSAARRHGLKNRQRLADDDGLWIAPCEAIHTFGMNFPIDVLFIDKYRRIRKIQQSLPPRRVAVCLKAASVLELAAGTAARLSLAVGDHVEFIPSEKPA